LHFLTKSISNDGSVINPNNCNRFILRQ